MNTFTVPQGETPETIRQREDLIYSFYQQWKEEHPDQKIFNVNLKDYINIRSISITETARHASKRYLSTLAVLQLDSILSCARKVSYEKPEKRDNQLAFKAMLMIIARENTRFQSWDESASIRFHKSIIFRIFEYADIQIQAVPVQA